MLLRLLHLMKAVHDAVHDAMDALSRHNLGGHRRSLAHLLVLAPVLLEMAESLSSELTFLFEREGVDKDFVGKLAEVGINAVPKFAALVDSVASNVSRAAWPLQAQCACVPGCMCACAHVCLCN